MSATDTKHARCNSYAGRCAGKARRVVYGTRQRRDQPRSVPSAHWEHVMVQKTENPLRFPGLCALRRLCCANRQGIAPTGRGVVTTAKLSKAKRVVTTPENLRHNRRVSTLGQDDRQMTATISCTKRPTISPLRQCQQAYVPPVSTVGTAYQCQPDRLRPEPQPATLATNPFGSLTARRGGRTPGFFSSNLGEFDSVEKVISSGDCSKEHSPGAARMAQSVVY